MRGCTVCGIPFGRDVAFLHFAGRGICTRCAPMVSAEELCMLTGAEDACEMLYRLGFEWGCL